MSRIVKPSKHIVYHDCIQINDLIIEGKTSEIDYENVIEETKINEPTVTVDLKAIEEEAQNIIKQAKLQAQQIITEANQKAETILKVNQEVIEKNAVSISEHAYIEAYEKGIQESKKDVYETLNTIEEEIKTFNKFRINDINNDFEHLSSQLHLLAVDIASTVLHKEINIDPSICKEVILAEVEKHKRQVISHVQISNKANSLYDSITEHLSKLNIEIELVDQNIDYIMLEGKMGNYDLSISTQLKNIFTLFEKN